MLKSLYKLFNEQLGLTADYWLYVFIGVVALSFIIALVLGLTTGKFKATTSAMKTAVAHPDKVVAAMKHMPQSIKTEYKNARLGNLKPSMLVTEDVCVNQPYKHSFASKIWLVTLIATLICAALAFVVSPIAALPEGAKNAMAGISLLEEGAEGGEPVIEDFTWLVSAQFTSAAIVLILGAILTLVGGIVGNAVHGGAVKLYEKFAPVMDGDGSAQAHQSYSEPQSVYSEPQATYAEPQAVFGEPQQEYEQPQTVVEPQQGYEQPQSVVAPESNSYDEPPVVTEPQESDEEIRRKAREEALRQARAAQQAQAQQQAQQARPAAAQQDTAGGSSVDEVIAEINRISEHGATREAMREVATRLQRERAKPENSSPETKKRLNEALSKLLKAMSSAK